MNHQWKNIKGVQKISIVQSNNITTKIIFYKSMEYQIFRQTLRNFIAILNLIGGC